VCVCQVAAYKAAEEQEVTDMTALRTFNMQKGADENDSVLYCICQRPHGGLMLQCELCKDWFHSE
jgi:histone demethylase JARID1